METVTMETGESITDGKKMTMTKKRMRKEIQMGGVDGESESSVNGHGGGERVQRVHRRGR